MDEITLLHCTGMNFELKVHCSLQLNELFSSSQQELEATSQRLQATSESLASTQDQLAVSRADLHQTRKERDEKDFLVEEHLRTEQTLLREAEEVRAHVQKHILVLVNYI